MNYDTMKISNEKGEKTIYILLEINKENHHYIIYTDRILDRLDKNYIYVGELIQEKLTPVPDELLNSFDEMISNINFK